MIEQQAPSKQCAPESAKTRKAREKLQKYWKDLEAKITPEALRATTDEIHRWIARHAYRRVLLKDKNISLFDENQNTAKISQRVNALVKQLHEDMKKYVERDT